MLCRRKDDLTSSTSHVMSNCILNYFDTAGQRRIFYDAEDGKIKHADAVKWKICCKDCEGKFSSLGETNFSEWMDQFYKVEHYDAVHVSDGEVLLYSNEIKDAKGSTVSPLFHAIAGICCRCVLYLQLEEEGEYFASFSLLEFVRRYFIKFLSEPWNTTIAFEKLNRKHKNLSELFTKDASAPKLYCFHSDSLANILRDHSPDGNHGFTDVRVFFAQKEGKYAAYCQCIVYGLVFVMVKDDTDRDIVFRDINRQWLVDREVTEDTKKLFMGKLLSTT